MSGERYAERRRRALEDAEAAGLAGILVSPGPDLAYLMAYAPLPLERLTLLVLSAGTEPTLVVPTLERPLAERAAGASGLTLRDWRDGRDDPHAIVAGMLGSGRYAVTDRTWASHLLSLQRAASEGSFVAAGEALPLLRAVKDADEIERLRAAGSAADAAFADVVAPAVRRPSPSASSPASSTACSASTAISASISRSSVRVRTRPPVTTSRGSGGSSPAMPS